MATPAPALSRPISSAPGRELTLGRPAKNAARPPDRSLWVGLAVAALAFVGGVLATGVSPRYFFQSTGILVVVGGTLGVTLISSPREFLNAAVRGLRELTAPETDRLLLFDELQAINRVRRSKGLWALEAESKSAAHPLLRDLLLAAVDAPNRADFQAAIETRWRIAERQSEIGAKALETAGGFAPTLGVLGTVAGLIDVLRQFSNLNGVTGGIGTAFVSTIYGLALANLLLLPAACRIRARAAEMVETADMIGEGALCIYDGVHPTLMQERLRAFLKEPRR